MWPSPPVWAGPNTLDNWWSAPTAAGRRIFSSNGRTFINALSRAIQRELAGTANFLPPPRRGVSDGTVTDAVRIQTSSMPVNDGRWTRDTSAALYQIAVRDWNDTSRPVNQRSNLSTEDATQLQEDYLINSIGIVGLRVACWLLSGPSTVAYNSINVTASESSSEGPPMGVVWQGNDTQTFTIFDPTTGPTTAQTSTSTSRVPYVIAAAALGGILLASNTPNRRRRRRSR